MVHLAPASVVFSTKGANGLAVVPKPASQQTLVVAQDTSRSCELVTGRVCAVHFVPPSVVAATSASPDTVPTARHSELLGQAMAEKALALGGGVWADHVFP